MSDDTLSENWATLWEAFADAQPDQTAVVVGERSQTWRDLDDQAARLASALAERGATVGTRIAQLMYNCPEYLESSYAAFKLRATPINVNYRYKAPEIAYICNNAGAEVIVFHGSLGPQLADAVADMPTVRSLLQVDDGTPLIEGAEWYHDVVVGRCAGAAHRALGRRHPDALHRRHHRKSEGRRVAPRRPVRGARLHRVHVCRYRGADHARRRRPDRSRTPRRTARAR